MKKEIAILFDMDGVIVDNKDQHIKAWVAFGKKNQIPITDDDIYNLFGNTNNEILKYFYNRELTKEEVKNFAEEKEALYREIYAKEIKPAPGLSTILKEMKAKGYRIAVATSGPKENLDFVLERTGLAEYFDQHVYESMIKKGKPDPEVFIKAAGLLDASIDNCLVFEDSVFGIDAALAAGMKVVALTTTYPASALGKATRIIKDFTAITLSEIENLLKENP